MQQIIKKSFWTICLILGWQQAVWGFTLGGPVANGGDSWQTQDLGYNPLATKAVDSPFGFIDPRLTGPKNIGEEYRRNTPKLYFTFDQNFVGYFGANGTNAVIQGYQVLNSLTNVDNYSSDLAKFSLNASGVNYQAQILDLYDLKSLTMAFMMEQLGLADSVRYTWALRSRWKGASGACPVGEYYYVTERNFALDPNSQNGLPYSPYVNGSLYTYQLFEYCGASAQAPITAAVLPTPADPLNANSSIASGLGLGYLYPGQFYTGLTRDDVAGLRYLLQAKNVNYETASGQQFVIHKTMNAPESFPPSGYSVGTNSGGTNFVYIYYYSGGTNGGFGYGNLSQFISYAQTNGPTALQAQYPGVVISSYTNTAVWASNEVYSSYYYNPPGSFYGDPPVLQVVTNYIGYWKNTYQYQFANVFTNHYYSNAVAAWQTTTVSAPAGSFYGAPMVTNTTITLTNQVDGDFFVLPMYGTNICPLDIIDSSHFNVVAFTNYLTTATTNFATSTNTVSISSSVALVTYFTNYSYLINPTSCELVSNPTGKYEGIENIKFVPVDYHKYDYVNQVWYTPITNYYTMSEENSNGVVTIQNFMRVLTQPDFLFSAQDLTAGENDYLWASVTPNYNEANVLPGLAGPGTIDAGPVTFTLNKVGPLYYNYAPTSLNGPYNGRSFLYGSFDGTTNAPVVYPQGTSIGQLETQVFIQINPNGLPPAIMGQAYSNTFTVSGGQAPYTWSLSSDSSALPAGLTLSSDGLLSGTPTQNGVYGFTVQLKDSAAHTVQRPYTITIN